MKFAVVLALFFACAQSSAVLPYAAWPYGAGAWAPSWNAHVAAPITQYSSWPAYAHAPAAVSYAAHVAAPYAAAPWVAAPAAYVAAPVAKVVVPHVAASYTAANRGSVHTAPLPGHAVSQTSLNLAPAPGTL